MNYQFIPKEDLSQAAHLSEYSFRDMAGNDWEKELGPLIENKEGIGGYVGKQLATQLFIRSFEMNIFGKRMPMGGISFVATYPEHRKGGLTKHLLLKSLEVMRDKGQVLSVLSPFSISFYRHFGWEVFFEKSTYLIPADSAQLREKHSGDVHRFDLPSEDANEWLEKIIRFHNQMVEKQHGHLFRSKEWWKRINRREPSTHFAISLNEKKEVKGYLRYSIDASELKIRDFYTADKKAEQSLWSYVRSHVSQVDKIAVASPLASSAPYHFKNPEFDRTSYFDKMIRIVDAKEFLKLFPFADIAEPLYVKIRDTRADWNNHIFKISPGNDVKIVDEAPSDELLTMDIGPFTSMMVGYHDIRWYKKHGYAQISDQASIKWQHGIPSEFPKINDNF